MLPEIPLSRQPLSGTSWSSVEYDPDDDRVVMLDQRRLPADVVYHRYSTPDEVADAIRTMVVRGAPAIGLAAAYALVLQAGREIGDAGSFLVANGIASRVLNATRPTAVNLAWAIARMGRQAAEAAALDPSARHRAMLAAAEAMHRDDVRACQSIGKQGAADMPPGSTVLTHCNTGGLATGGYGTAAGVIRSAWQAGKIKKVLASETRPYLQGARLTSWELHADGIDVEVITDSMAGLYLQQGEIQSVVVGADRVAANGDVANKIGTYGLAVLARAHEVPFAVAAPFSTVDLSTPTGDAIPIEQRSRDEIARFGGQTVVADGIPCRHPAFDITPARLVDALYTERGRVRPAHGEQPADLRAAASG